MSVGNCLSCGRKIGGVDGVTSGGRGICRNCHSSHTNKGTLEQFPRKMWKRDELIAEADRLLSYGMRREDVGQRLGVKWSSIVSAKQRARHHAEQKAKELMYTEHNKLKEIAPLSQSIGEFLEWLNGQGVCLMRWTETTETRDCDGGLMSLVDCRGAQCKNCGGTGTVSIKRSGWVPYSTGVTDVLAAFFDINQVKLEQEKRHMLDDLRKRNEVDK